MILKKAQAPLYQAGQPRVRHVVGTSALRLRRERRDPFPRLSNLPLGMLHKANYMLRSARVGRNRPGCKVGDSGGLAQEAETQNPSDPKQAPSASLDLTCLAHQKTGPKHKGFQLVTCDGEMKLTGNMSLA